jgi:hypothetical protein
MHPRKEGAFTLKGLVLKACPEGFTLRELVPKGK